MEASKNELFVRATNLETAIEIKIPAKVEQPGMVIISGKTLSAFLSHIKDETILLQNQKENIFIKTNQTETTLRGFSPDEFPLFPHIDVIASCTLAVEDIRTALHQVVIAVSTSDIKPELASVSWKLFKNSGKLAATDSFRLAERTIISKKNTFDNVMSFLLPSIAAHELARLFEGNTKDNAISFGKEKEITIEFNKNQIIVRNTTMRFISRLTEGNFPDYEQIIPKNFSTEVVIEKDVLLQQIRFASVFVGKLNDMSIEFNPQKKEISFHASNPDTGEHTAHITASIQGETGSAKFNWRYLYDGVQNITTEYVILGFNGEQSPLFVKGKGDQSYLYLAMPLRGL